MTSTRTAPAVSIPGRSTATIDRRRLLGVTGGAIAATLHGRATLGQTDPSHGHGLLATPAAGSGPEALLTLLAFVPASVSVDAGVQWFYADVAQQFASLNLHRDAEGPAWDDEPWVPATHALATGSNAFRYTRREDFIEAIGFQPLGTDQNLLAGEPPNQLTLFRGGLDQERLEAAWSATGYEPRTLASGATVWTIGPDFEFDVGHPVQSVVFAAFNNLALVGDVLVCAPSLAMIEEARSVAESGEGSLLADATLGAALATLPGTTVSAMGAAPLVPGDILVASTDPAVHEALMESLAEADAETGPMPMGRGMVVGVTAGAVVVPENLEDAPYDAPDFNAGEGLALVRLAMASPDDAAQAVAVVEHRWSTMNSLYTMQPYTELMEIVAASAQGDVAAIDFAQTFSPAVWRDMLLRRDLLPFVPTA